MARSLNDAIFVDRDMQIQERMYGNGSVEAFCNQLSAQE